ncbi:MAG: MFS transporter [Sphingobium sp.]
MNTQATIAPKPVQDTHGEDVHGDGGAIGFSLMPLTLMVFACSMAMMAFISVAGPIARVMRLEPWQLGMTLAIAGVAWMVMARLWGIASDRRGRRPILLTGLSGFVISYMLLSAFIAFGLSTPILPMLAFAGLVLGRGLAGAFYAAVPSTSMALIADHVPPARRAQAMAALGAASAAGMVVGPALAGLLAAIDLALPLYLLAIPPLIALIVLWRILPAPATPPPAMRKPAPRLTDPRLRIPLILAFIASFSVAVAQITVGFFTLDRLHLDPAAAASVAGIALAAVGVAQTLSQTILRRLKWPAERFIRIGAVIAAIGFASVMLVTFPAMLWISYGVAAFGMGWIYPSVSALTANAVEPSEQGAAAGSVGSAQGLGLIMGPIIGTALYTIDNGIAYGVIGVMLLSATILVRPKPPATKEA